MSSALNLVSLCCEFSGELGRLKGLPVGDIVAGVMEKIREFSQDEPQADDITMMIIQYNGSDEVSSVVATAET